LEPNGRGKGRPTHLYIKNPVVNSKRGRGQNESQAGSQKKQSESNNITRHGERFVQGPGKTDVERRRRRKKKKKKRGKKKKKRQTRPITVRKKFLKKNLNPGIEVRESE